MKGESIISIQSQVFDGFCGNSVATFVLRRRGHNPKILSTVQYYSKFKHIGVEIKSDQLQAILSEFTTDMLNLENDNNVSNNNIYFLTGFIKSKECADVIINNILKLKNCIEPHVNGEIKQDNYLIQNLININYFWLCDPVMGDNGRLYVESGIVSSYKNSISFYDIVTPNHYELELLCDTKIVEESDVIKSLNFLIQKGVKIAILTSINYAFDKDHLYLYVGFLNNKNELICYKYKMIRYDFNICGTGDLFSSLLLSFIVRQRGSILRIISQVLNIMSNVIKNSLNSKELHIIENQELIASNGLTSYEIKEEAVIIP